MKPRADIGILSSERWHVSFADGGRGLTTVTRWPVDELLDDASDRL